MDQTQNNQGARGPMNTKQNNTVMAILSYIGPLVIVSYIVAKAEPFVKFHIKQGSILFAIEVVVWILGSMWWPLWPLWNLVNLTTFILSIIGIVHAAKGEEKALPLIGHWSKHIPV
jgi:uncharacterized membrane protein